MSFFIKTVPEEEATGTLREYYDQNIQNFGQVSNTTRTFSLRPETWEAWMGLIKAIRRKMHMRDYELTTFAAAMKMDCTFCMLAHGAILHKNFFTVERLEAIARDYHHAGLDGKEVAMMDFAQKVVSGAASTRQEDIDHLRSVGWSDEEILNITLTAAARSFASKVFDALGAEPDAFYEELDQATHHALIGKRPFVVRQSEGNGQTV